MRKGIFIPDITVEMFKNCSMEGVEELLVSGTMEDIEIPDRPHGEWIEKHCDYGMYYRCSNCHKMPPNYECDYKEGAIKTNFCPNCGSDMRKEGEKLENDRRGIPGIQEEDEKAE